MNRDEVVEFFFFFFFQGEDCVMNTKKLQFTHSTLVRCNFGAFFLLIAQFRGRGGLPKNLIYLD